VLGWWQEVFFNPRCVAFQACVLESWCSPHIRITSESSIYVSTVLTVYADVNIVTAHEVR
jgi:hypothetical protein